MLQLIVGHWIRSCHRAKRNRSTSDSAHSMPAASTELEATVSQDASSTSVADPEAGSQLKQVCPPSALSEEDARTVILDIGGVVVKCATDEVVIQNLRSLPPSEKYAYLHVQNHCSCILLRQRRRRADLFQLASCLWISNTGRRRVLTDSRFQSGT